MAGGRYFLPLLLFLALSHISANSPGETSKKLPQAMYNRACGTNFTAPVNSTATSGTKIDGGFLFGVLFRPDAATNAGNGSAAVRKNATEELEPLNATCTCSTNMTVSAVFFGEVRLTNLISKDN
ncbi:hypothetical protein T484DRAFT_1810745 [Baffinella frigidus]|nr:hypothetical protein T484DRAFT_1810745 [Cryptophyta sp. CCMP2293]